MVRTSFTLSRQNGAAHPGTLRLAVFSWLFARHSGGEFRLRAEDTDTEARTDNGGMSGAETLKWLGLDWDGVIVRQSERLGHYASVASKLSQEGRAYPCYCTLQEIEERNKGKSANPQAHHYDGKCRNLTAAEIKKFESEGRQPAIRFAAYDQDFSYVDLHKGKVVIPAGTVGDFIILRSNRTPVGFFAETADHCDSGVTHLFRNEEHPSATVRSLMLCRALGTEPPALYFLPALTDTEGRKMQNNGPGTDTREAGYLPEAVLNHLALLGWKSPDGRELLGRDELIKLFSPEGLTAGTAEFDRSQLDWISRHVVINLDLESIFERSVPFFANRSPSLKEMLDDPVKREKVRNTVDLVRGYCGNMSEIVDHAVYFLTDDYPFDPEARNILRKAEAGKILSAFGDWIKKNEKRMDENLFGEMIADISKRTEVRGKALFQTLKAALTGRTDGPDIYYLVPVIGKENALKRIERIGKEIPSAPGR